jgi:hypothetical protein
MPFGTTAQPKPKRELDRQYVFAKTRVGSTPTQVVSTILVGLLFENELANAGREYIPTPLNAAGVTQARASAN